MAALAMPAPKSDTAAIDELLVRFQEALNHQRWESLDTIFTGDVAVNWFDTQHRHGRNAVVRQFRDYLQRKPRARYVTDGYRIHVSPDHAEALWHPRVYRLAADGTARGPARTLGAFTARLVRTDAGWRIRHLDVPW